MKPHIHLSTNNLSKLDLLGVLFYIDSIADYKSFVLVNKKVRDAFRMVKLTPLPIEQSHDSHLELQPETLCRVEEKLFPCLETISLSLSTLTIIPPAFCRNRQLILNDVGDELLSIHQKYFPLIVELHEVTYIEESETKLPKLRKASLNITREVDPVFSLSSILFVVGKCPSLKHLVISIYELTPELVDVLNTIKESIQVSVFLAIVNSFINSTSVDDPWIDISLDDISEESEMKHDDSESESSMRMEQERREKYDERKKAQVPISQLVPRLNSNISIGCCDPDIAENTFVERLVFCISPMSIVDVRGEVFTKPDVFIELHGRHLFQKLSITRCTKEEKKKRKKKKVKRIVDKSRANVVPLDYSELSLVYLKITSLPSTVVLSVPLTLKTFICTTSAVESITNFESLKLRSLEIENNKTIKIIQCRRNLTSLRVQHCSAVSRIKNVRNARLQNFEVSDCDSLKTFGIPVNLTKFILENLATMTKLLDTEKLQLLELEIKNCPRLTTTTLPATLTKLTWHVCNKFCISNYKQIPLKELIMVGDATKDSETAKANTLCKAAFPFPTSITKIEVNGVDPSRCISNLREIPVVELYMHGFTGTADLEDFVHATKVMLWRTNFVAVLPTQNEIMELTLNCCNVENHENLTSLSKLTVISYNSAPEMLRTIEELPIRELKFDHVRLMEFGDIMLPTTLTALSLIVFTGKRQVQNLRDLNLQIYEGRHDKEKD